MTCILLFDLDETLYAPDTGVMDHIRARMHEYICDHLALASAEAHELRRRYLHEYGTTLRGLQINGQVDTEDYLQYVHDIPLERYLHSNSELDAALAAIPLAKVIFTNSSREHAERVLAVLGIRRHFSRIIDVRDVGYESKPQPESYRRACELLEARPQDCLIVEDSVRNLRTAKALGMTTILVHDGRTKPDAWVDIEIRRIEQIGTVLALLGQDHPQDRPPTGQEPA